MKIFLNRHDLFLLVSLYEETYRPKLDHNSRKPRFISSLYDFDSLYKLELVKEYKFSGKYDLTNKGWKLIETIQSHCNLLLNEGPDS